MCTRPITITRTYPLVGTKQYLVPCGKCAECRSRKRSELAALSVHQASVSSSMFFITFTYRNECVPVAISLDYCGERRLVGFERGCADWLKNGNFYNRVLDSLDMQLCCSLRREDIKNVLKEFRIVSKRKFKDKSLDFKYVVFGEYGDKTGRPHYHGLFYGLDFEQVELLCSLWNKRFGFTYKVPEIKRKLDYKEQIAVSQYVSKYISKGINARFDKLLPYVEKPRRQSSLNFGDFSSEELVRLSDFTMAAILGCFHSLVFYLDGLPLWSWICSLNVARPIRLMVALLQFHRH